MSTPVITIFVRHSEGCKYAGDEFSRRCSCKKHLRWTMNGKQHRQKTGARTWAEAEDAKQNLLGQLSGQPVAEKTARLLSECFIAFMEDREVSGIVPSVTAKYRLDVGRFRSFCEEAGVYTLDGVTRELIVRCLKRWERVYPSSQTRYLALARVKTFMRFCHESRWITHMPAFPKIKVDVPETMPLEGDEFDRLLLAVQEIAPEWQQRIRCLFLLMRWTGLAIRDALTLERAEIQTGDVCRVVTSRQKTKTPVSVPIPRAVAEEILQLPGTKYLFWDGRLNPLHMVQHWSSTYVVPAFEAAGIVSAGNMKSHRLRDTFAVDLLQKGVPLEEVSKLLGHTSIRTTEKHYAKWVKGRQDRLDSLVTATWTA